MSHFKINPLLACFLGISIAAATPRQPKKDLPSTNPTQSEKSLPAKPDKATKPAHQKSTPASTPVPAPVVAPDSPEDESESKDDGPDCDGCILALHGKRNTWPVAMASTLWGLFGVKRPRRSKVENPSKGITTP